MSGRKNEEIREYDGEGNEGIEMEGRGFEKEIENIYIYFKPKK